MKLIRSKLFSIISIVLILLMMVFSSLAFSDTYLSIKTAEMSKLDQMYQAYEPDYYYANINIKDTGTKSTIESLFLNSYVKNFGGTSTRLVSVSGDDGLVDFRTLYNDLELPFKTSPVSGLYYTNKKDLPMLETVCLNLLIYREKSEETHIDYSVYDGFIYIPDYYADFIIENTGDINSYMDIINTAETNVLYFEYNTRLFKYKIANIFHVKGFKQEYCEGIDIKYNDYNNGQKLDYLFNGFCFVSNYNHFTLFDDRFYNTLVLQIGAKKYELEENLLNANQFKNKNDAEYANATIFFHTKDGLYEYDNSSSISSLFFEPHVNKINIWFVLIIVVSFVIYLFICLMSCFNKCGYFNNPRLHLISFIEVFLFLFVGFILKKVINSTPIFYFFNPHASGICVGLLIITFIIMVLSFSIYIKKGKQICE